jgi:hypothetical protein
MESQVEQLPERLIVEVALNVLSDNDIEDLSEANAVIAERAGVPAGELEALAEAAAKDMTEIQGAARFVLADIASTPEGAETVASAVDEAGKKQFVLGGSELILISLLISGILSAYVAVQTRGKKSDETQTEVEFDDKGRVKALKRKNKVVYVDSQSGFAGLLQRLLPKMGNKQA